jgi:hypothetical protein
VADGLVLPHAPALVLSFLTVVFVSSMFSRRRASTAFVKTGFSGCPAEAPRFFNVGRVAETLT